MPSLRIQRNIASVLAILALICVASVQAHSQAALLMEEPYGFFGALNPTGHTAIYFNRICAETPTHLRPCEPGEYGSVIARYQGIHGYDWIAIPLVPYLYSVENTEDVPDRVNKETVRLLRDRYHEEHLMNLGRHVSRGGFLHGGWSELIGVAYERRIFAFRFNTTPEQDYAIMDELNAGPNKSHFHLLFSNCADFARLQLDSYFPGHFHRNFFPDLGMTTPKLVAHDLIRYGRRHSELNLTTFEIPQVPGYRRHSGHNKDIAESLVTTVYAVPIAIANPYIAGALVVDYLVRGRFHSIVGDPMVLEPEDLAMLTEQAPPVENPSLLFPADGSTGRQTFSPSAPLEMPAGITTGVTANEQ